MSEGYMTTNVSYLDVSREEYLKARFSHVDFLEQRDWLLIEKIWQVMMKRQSLDRLPKFICGNNDENSFGITDLSILHEIGKTEFASGNPKYKRTTLAFCIGYLGSAYTGYQQQRGVDGILTVEDDLDLIFAKKAVAAGRTDKGVSALSQIVSYATYDPVSPEEILERASESEACKSGRLAVWSCKRVPRKFHPLFGATWRRYLYFIPLSKGSFEPYSCDIDVAFINDAFSYITEQPLPYNGFAHRENRATEEGNGDICTLYRAKALVFNVTEVFPEIDKIFNNPSCENVDSLEFRQCNGQVMCIELVGDRFLRRMVRILVATVIRESVLPLEARNVCILHDIALSRDRYKAAAAAPSVGLGLCGVGFDLEDLADLKSSKKPPPNAPTSQAGTGVSAIRKKRKLAQQASAAEINRLELDGSDDALVDFQEQPNSKLSSAISTNTSKLAFPDESDISILVNDAWKSFKNELISCDPELLFQPERAFSFTYNSVSKDLVLPQSYVDVGSTIWDAETILAHFLHDNIVTNKYAESESIPSFFEIGAGTALSALAWLQTWTTVKPSSSSSLIAVAQETPEVLPMLQSLLSQQPLGKLLSVVSGFWGQNLLQQLCLRLHSNGIDDQQSVPPKVLSSIKFDTIVMADVFYHEEHFNDLMLTILSLLADEGEIIIVFEQRRKNLSDFILSLATHRFNRKEIFQYDVTRCVNNGEGDDGMPAETTASATFYICHFTGFIGNGGCI